MDGVILSGLRRERHAQNLTPKYFHKEFIRLLKDINWPDTSYPFDQQHMGYESCRKYLNTQIKEFKMPKSQRPREILTRTTTTIPYQEIQIDAQTQDVTTSITIDVNGHTSDLRLSRLTLFLATDVATGCHLAYQLCLTKDPSQLDLLSLLEMIHTPWEPIELKTPGLSYQPGACLPSALGELTQNASIGMVRMDNALCHMSHMVRNYVCNELGATLNFGLPAQPKSRNMVEYAFKRLNEYTHRFAATTGSNTQDPLKEAKKNTKKPPVLTINTLNEVLSVLITHHNVTPQERFGGLSPLDVMKSSLENLLVPMSFAHLEKRANPFLRQKKASVRCLSKENRRPHVNFEGFRYSGAGLNKSELIDREIVIEYDIRDLRSIKAYSSVGEQLGTLYAPKSWQKYSHSLYTRRIIRKITRVKRILGSDPLSGYFAYLLENKGSPKQATELLRIYKEYTSNPHPVADNKSAVTQPDSRVKTSQSNSIPAWSPKLAEDED